MAATLLYVEDSALVGRLLVAALALEGITVTLATDVDAAMEALDQCAGAFDLVLCDYKLPGTTGLDVLRLIRQRYPSLPLVLTTGFASNDVERAAADFDGFLHKPFEIADLVALLNRHIN